MEQQPVMPKSQRVFGELTYWITIVATIICTLGPLIIFMDMDNNVLNPHYLMDNIFDGMGAEFEEQMLMADASAGATVLLVEDAEKFTDPQDVDRNAEIRIVDHLGNGEIATITAIDKKTDSLTLSTGLLNSYKAEETEVAETTIWNSKGNVRLGANAAAGQNTIKLADAGRIDAPTDEQSVSIMIMDQSNRETVIIKSTDKETDTVTLASNLTHSYSLDQNAVVSQITVVDDTKGGHFWLDNITKGDGLTQFGLVIGCAVGLPAMVGAAWVFGLKDKSRWWTIAALWVALMILVSAIGLIAIE